MNRYEKRIATINKKYTPEQRAAWGSKGGSAKVKKGFAVTNNASEMAKRRVQIRHEQTKDTIEVRKV